MATTMIIGGETHHMPIWLKARLLVSTIETTDDANVLTVESGTDRNKRHAVTHDGAVALSCSCPAVGVCAHKQAVNKYLEVGEMERVAMAIIAEEQSAKQQVQETRKAQAITRANAYRNELAASPWSGKCAVTNNRAQHPAVVEAERHLAEQRKIEAFSFMK